jgi:hypothetical protein
MVRSSIDGSRTVYFAEAYQTNGRMYTVMSKPMSFQYKTPQERDHPPLSNDICGQSAMFQFTGQYVIMHGLYMTLVVESDLTTYVHVQRTEGWLKRIICIIESSLSEGALQQGIF